MFSRTIVVWCALVLAIAGCAEPHDPAGPGDTEPNLNSTHNILFIIADDMGKDATFGFSEGLIKPSTPRLNGIASQGVRFTNLWVNPTCTPTRASIITGKYGFRTGVTRSGLALPTSETVLQSYISQQSSRPYATAVVGKWHLAQSPTFNPESLGIDYYAGVLSAAPESYFDWELTEDGQSTANSGYITEVLTDLAIDWVAEQDDSWFLWLAYNAPHSPFHVPPADMHSQGSLPEFQAGTDATRHYMAAIEAMDFQIGRLLDSLTPEERSNTTIVFIGDNGSPGQVAQAPYEAGKAKGSLYQGGINTPMFVAGSGVTRLGTDDSLVNGTDLFATLAALAGVAVDEIHDSKSFESLLSAAGPHRETAYSEISEGMQDSWTIRNGQYKLIGHPGREEEMFDLVADPYETEDLLNGVVLDEHLQAKMVLEGYLDGIRR
jgi:arylsulfatase B